MVFASPRVADEWNGGGGGRNGDFFLGFVIVAVSRACNQASRRGAFSKSAKGPSRFSHLQEGAKRVVVQLGVGGWMVDKDYVQIECDPILVKTMDDSEQ